MKMLSRVAERLYWMARYLERMEDSARLTRAYTHLVMDIPEGTQPEWDILVNILDAQDSFAGRYRTCNEQNVLRFLIADEENGCSLCFNIAAARENVRTTRDVLPEEVWEQINGLYLYTREFAGSSVGRRHRYRFLEQVIGRCQMINGLIHSTLCRDHSYRFIKLGKLLERADMTSRVIDVGVGALLADSRHRSSVDPLLWSSILQSLSAMGTYRRTIGPLVEANSVVNFVFKEPSLPRSIKFCLNGMREELAPLKNNEEALKLVDRHRRNLSRFKAEAVDRDQLHQFIDRFQLGLHNVNDIVATTWFMRP